MMKSAAQSHSREGLAPILAITILVLVGTFAHGAQAQSPSTGIAEVNGTKLYYEMAGKGHPLVLIHGGAVDRRAWDDQFPVFSRSYQVIRYDLRGSGKSAIPQKPYSNAEDLYALLRFLKVDKTVLMGISRGGGRNVVAGRSNSKYSTLGITHRATRAPSGQESGGRSMIGE